MKIVREHINEKFTEDSDPIRDMGIGFPLNFNNYTNHSRWIVNNLPYILKTEDIPEDILLGIHDGYYINPIYFGKIQEFAEKNLRFNNIVSSIDAYTLRQMLIKKGYKHYKL